MSASNQTRFFMRYLLFVLILFFMIWVSYVSAASFTIDFLNLQEAFPSLNLAAAYFKVSLKEAWGTINDLNPSLSRITIGVIDTGLDVKHPEFSQFPKVNLGNTPLDARIDSGELMNEKLKSHGTNIAGIIGANNISATSSGNYVPPHMNGILGGVRGLDYTLEVRKHAKPFALFSAAKKIFETSSSGAQIINLSFNVTFNPIGAVIFDWSFIVHPNTLFIVAAGNNNQSVGIFTPANLGAVPNVITVGATTLNDQREPDSNFGDIVSISAPGEEVFSPTFFTEPLLDAGDYEFFSGTSASAPLVTGVAGLIKAIKPDLTPAQIKQILIETGDPISTDKPIGPRLNAYKAVCHLLVLNCVPPTVILQPGPGEGKDIWTTSVYSYAPGGGGPGGGLDDEELVVGGWGDLYYSLLQFNLSGMPSQASIARLELFPFTQRGIGTTGIYLYRIAEFWDWKTQGTGRDRERLWWADRPPAVQWIPGALPAPILGQWYSIDITDIYNAWQNNTCSNYGVQLRPVSNMNRWDEFYGSDYLGDPTLRPRLVVTPASGPISQTGGCLSSAGPATGGIGEFPVPTSIATSTTE